MQSNNHLLTRCTICLNSRILLSTSSWETRGILLSILRTVDLSCDRELSEGRHTETPASPGIWWSWAKVMQCWEGMVWLPRSQKWQRCLHSPSLAKAKPKDRCSGNSYSTSFSTRWNWYVCVLLSIILLTSGNFKAPIHQRNGPWIFLKHSVAFPLLIFQLACGAYSQCPYAFKDPMENFNLMSDSMATSPLSSSKTCIIKWATKANRESQRPSILSVGISSPRIRKHGVLCHRAAQLCDLDWEDRFACCS